MPMMRILPFLLLHCLVFTSFGIAQEVKPDFGKSLIERPVKKLVEHPDLHLRIEKALKDHAIRKSIVSEKLLTNQRNENPKVKPGLVNWHSNFEAACKASAKSGKPVFLFHLLGQLDQRFT